MPRRKEPSTGAEKLQDTVNILTARLEVADEEMHQLRRELQQSVPLVTVHEYLDATGAPRAAMGRNLFVQERIHWCAKAIHGREIE